jgi:hypothetical protein
MLCALPVSAQEASFLAEDAADKYWIKTDVVYDVENGHENKLDVIYPHNAAVLPSRPMTVASTALCAGNCNATASASRCVV